MPLKSKVKVLRIEKDIRALLEQRKTSQEIMDILSIPERTFRRYCSRIYTEDQKTLLSITKNELASELLRLRSSLEETYKISKEMANDPKCEDRLAALQSKDDARLSIVQLLTDVDMLRKLQVQPSQDKTTVRAYEEKYAWKENAEQVSQNEE